MTIARSYRNKLVAIFTEPEYCLNSAVLPDKMYIYPEARAVRSAIAFTIGSTL
jgi:hypothetical protein